MIHIELKGGLGNQLFQYAAALALAKEKNTTVAVDITNLDAKDKTLGTYRSYKLNKLKNPPTVQNFSSFKKNVIKLGLKFVEKFNINSKGLYKERGFAYEKISTKCSSNSILFGNFQSYKYFDNCEKEIKTSLCFSLTEQYNEVSSLLKDVQYLDSVSIHIRRGDYLSNSIAYDVLGVLPMTYYNLAIDKIIETNKNCTFFVFSDDIVWAKENMILKGHHTYFIDIESKDKDIVEFSIMSSCKHNIIANSSFSWWAAYLNPNPNKIVIAPKKWFNNAPYDTKDLFPPDWILM